jgi:hypothetical protein
MECQGGREGGREGGGSLEGRVLKDGSKTDLVGS